MTSFPKRSMAHNIDESLGQQFTRAASIVSSASMLKESLLNVYTSLFQNVRWLYISSGCRRFTRTIYVRSSIYVLC